MASATLIIILSSRPPAYPEIPPYKRPMGKDIKSARNPMVKEILPPYKILEKLSRPLISSPSKYNSPPSSIPTK